MQSDIDLLRKELWLRHGCSGPALYGDDGEMQCHVCRIDFKRDPISTIVKSLRSADMMRFASKQSVPQAEGAEKA